MKNLFNLKDVIFRQGESFSLSIEQLDLFSDRIYTLVGPNGAGKSTLLRLLAFLATPQGGTIHLAEGKGTPAQHRRKVTLVEQSPYLLRGTVADNIAYGLKLRGVRGHELQQKISSSLRRVGLEEFSERRSDKLSGGEKQRIALARALALQPEVLLLDEPTANIDNQSQELFERLLKKLPGEGMTVILSTHDPLQSERLNGETIHIENGQLQPAPFRPVVSEDFHHKEQKPWLKALNMHAQ